MQYRLKAGRATSATKTQFSRFLGDRGLHFYFYFAMEREFWVNIFLNIHGYFSDRSWKAHFGLTIALVTQIWHYLLPARFQPIHLLWTLYFLKYYHQVDHAHVFWHVSPTTYIHRIHQVLLALDENLPGLLQAHYRFDNPPLRGNAWLALDTKLCPIELNRNNWHFQARYYSPYHRKHGYKYEFAVDLKTGYILWVSGPYYGSESDLAICLGSGILQLLIPNEKMYGDKAYVGILEYVLPPFKGTLSTLTNAELLWNWYLASKRVIVENAIGRFSKFMVTRLPYRHNQAVSHDTVIRIVARIASLDVISNPIRKDIHEEHE